MFETPETMEETSEQEWKDETDRKNVLASLERVGCCEVLHEDVIDRMIRIEKGSRFNEYSRKIKQGIGNVFNLLKERYSEQYPELRHSDEQRLEVLRAAILHDIGKSGPAEATPQEQEMIIKIFAHENIRDTKLLVTEEIRELFETGELESAQRMLEKYGIGGKTTMQQFWDKHAYWTHDILEKYPQGLSENTRIIAGSHHIDHDIDPYELNEKDKTSHETRTIGILENYVDALERRVLIVLDQYEAAKERRGFSHEEALAWVKDNLAKSKNLEKNKWITDLIFAAVDELGSQGKVFQHE
ncbi:MAG: hypothetical protein NTY33_03980 [Candidatus Moranbacteria bacterium]|nr:hypothetical protein [Candidatus Moranbacteria bacterium]